jgi:CRP/FNR family cyclic AMP-dependent transcriptional regulator
MTHIHEEGEAGMCPKEDVFDAFKKIPWFSGLKDEHLNQIAAISFVRKFKSGERFFQEGDKQDYIYVLTEGRVALDMFVPHHGKLRFSTLEQWDVFGWSSVTPTIHQRTAGAVAVLDGEALATDAEKLRQACEKDHDLGYLVMRRLAGVVASRLMETRLQLIDMFGEPAENKNVE